MTIAVPAKDAVPFKVRDFDSNFEWWAVLENTGNYALFYQQQHAIDWINHTGRIPDAELAANRLRRLTP